MVYIANLGAQCTRQRDRQIFRAEYHWVLPFRFSKPVEPSIYIYGRKIWFPEKFPLKRENKTGPCLALLILITPVCDRIWHPAPTHKVQKFNYVRLKREP